MRRLRVAAFAAVAAICVVPGLTTPAARVAAQGQIPDILARSRALYPTLKTYSDKGVVVVEQGAVTDRAQFATAFRSPNDFFFEYSNHVSIYEHGPKVPMPTHLVLWLLKGEMQKWDGALKTHDVVPADAGAQIGTLAGAGSGSEQTAILILPLIFAKARIVGPLQELVEAASAGEETVGGRRCHKVIGVARSVYPNGVITNIRPMTVWIDAETLLIRKVFEDTPKGHPGGGIFRRTITLEPQANMPLEDARFRYKVPN
jgi:hypothetical protein